MTTLVQAAGPATAGSAAGRGPGRPRTEALDERIIEATLALIDAGEEITVARVVSRSGVSRAALYRRWPSMHALVARALDLGRTLPPAYPEHPDQGQLLELILDAAGVGSGGATPTAERYPEARFRQRMRLVMTDRDLQRDYWAYVAERRAPTEDLLRSAVARGLLRADLDVEACWDAIAGVAYYQAAVRGDSMHDPAAMRRVRAAIETIWRGMAAG